MHPDAITIKAAAKCTARLHEAWHCHWKPLWRTRVVDRGDSNRAQELYLAVVFWACPPRYGGPLIFNLSIFCLHLTGVVVYNEYIDPHPEPIHQPDLISHATLLQWQRSRLVASIQADDLSIKSSQLKPMIAKRNWQAVLKNGRWWSKAGESKPKQVMCILQLALQ